MTAKTFPNVHPGEILLEEFLKPLDLSQAAVMRPAHVAGRLVKRAPQFANGVMP